MNDWIYKHGHKYFLAKCVLCGSDRGYVRKQHVDKKCRSCSAKQRAAIHQNPMKGKKHSDKSKFRKNSYSHYNYGDRLVEYTVSGNKRIRYRKSCPSCSQDMGYHRNVDGLRVCKICRDKAATKYTPEQRRLRSAVKANISARLRSRNSGKNYTSTFSMLSFTFEELLEHLETRFLPGMTFENYGKWEIDHITPDSWFDYGSYNDEGFKKSWSLKNLQPLWKADNASKGNKYEG